MTETVELTYDAPATGLELAASPSRRTLTGVVVPFGVPSGPASNTGRRYQFSTPPDNAGDAHDVVREHDDDRVIGTATVDAAGDALLGVARVFSTRDGDDALVEATEGVRAAFSAGVEILSAGAQDPRGVIPVTRWNLTHIGTVRHPAFTQARITDVAASAATLTEGLAAMADGTMVNGEFAGTISGTLTPTAPEPPPDGAAPAPDAPAASAARRPTGPTLSAADVAALVEARMAAGAPAAHPLARFGTLEEFTTAVRHGDVDAVELALVDQVTANNAGVVPPSWLKDVKGIIDRGRPLITAFGSESPGESGLDVNWPYYDGDLTAIVTAQASEKAAINGARIDIKKGTATLGTLAAGSDISYQLLMRSSPSYRDAHDRIMAAGYSAKSDSVAATSASSYGLAAGGGFVTYDPAAADADGSKLRAALLSASVKVMAATGQPAAFVLAASDAFVSIGGKAGLYPSQYGTQNVSGTADAATLSVSVSGLTVIHDPYLPAGKILVSNGSAASWIEFGPMFATADDVSKLGLDVAVWGMGVFAPYSKAGIVTLAATQPALAKNDGEDEPVDDGSDEDEAPAKSTKSK